MDSIYNQFDNGFNKDDYYLPSIKDKKCNNFNELMVLTMTYDYNNNSDKIAELLAENPEQLYEKNSLGYTALMLAVINTDIVSDENAVALLLQHGADIDEKNIDGLSPLMLSAFHDTSTVSTMNLLINNNANINAVDNFGNSALNYAIKSKNYAKVLMLLDTGALINMSNIDSYSPLHFAATNDPDILQLLLDRNDINPNIRTITGKTPLFIACQNLNTKNILKILKSKNVFVNATDNNGDTALLNVVSMGNMTNTRQNIIKLLLSNNADPFIKNKYNYDFFDKVDINTIMELYYENFKIDTKRIPELIVRNKDELSIDVLDFYYDIKSNNLL